jgi:hypothetical protein
MICGIGLSGKAVEMIELVGANGTAYSSATSYARIVTVVIKQVQHAQDKLQPFYDSAETRRHPNPPTHQQLHREEAE